MSDITILVSKIWLVLVTTILIVVGLINEPHATLTVIGILITCAAGSVVLIGPSYKKPDDG